MAIMNAKGIRQDAISHPLTIREVSSPEDTGRFVDFPFRLYEGNSYWVPPIKEAELAQFDPRKNPALEHSLLKLWIAEQEGQVVGRIGCFINDLETQMRGEPQARFNWLEFIDDPKVSQALMDTAADWAKSQGAQLLKGPLGFTNLDNAGMTVEGFEELGTMGASFHPPYYQTHLEKARFEKLTDYLEYVIDKVPQIVPKRLKRLRPLLEEKFGIRLIRFRRPEFKKRLRGGLFNLIVDTYQGLPSFVPLSSRQIENYVEQYLSFLDPGYIPLVQDARGEIVGFGVILPSYSRALKRAGGKLFPFGLFHLLWTRKFHRTVDFILIGVVEEWRNKGLNALMFSSYIERFKKKNIQKMFINPILEENQASIALFQEYNPRIFRRRRVFKREL
jgi:GNAT superfamily N-acetyltransferase